MKSAEVGHHRCGLSTHAQCDHHRWYRERSGSHFHDHIHHAGRRSRYQLGDHQCVHQNLEKGVRTWFKRVHGRKLTSVTTSRVAEAAVASTVAFTALESVADTGRSGAKVSLWSGAEVASGRRNSVRVDDVAELAGITASAFTYFEEK